MKFVVNSIITAVIVWSISLIFACIQDVDKYVAVITLVPYVAGSGTRLRIFKTQPFERT